MSEERPESCIKCGAPVVWCNCNRWVMHDFISGQDIELPAVDPDSPTEAWVQGWDANMHGGSDINPFDPCTQEAIDWQDGWDCAKRISHE